MKNIQVEGDEDLLGHLRFRFLLFLLATAWLTTLPTGSQKTSPDTTPG